MNIPPHIVRQLEEAWASDLPEQEIRQKYAEAVDWVNANVDLVALMRQSGIELKPISPDRPDVLVGRCPDCHGAMMVRSGHDG